MFFNSLHAVNLQDSIRRQKGIWKCVWRGKNKKTWNATPPSEWRECVWAKCVHLEVQKKISHGNLSPSHKEGTESSSLLNLHLHPKKAQRQTEEAMLWNSSSSGLISNHSLAFCNQNIHKHRRGWWFFHFLLISSTLLAPFSFLASCFFSSSLSLSYHQVKKGLLLWKLCV